MKLKNILWLAAAVLVLPALSFSQTAAEGLALADLSDRMDHLGKQMDELGEQMDMYGEEMDKYGAEMEKYGEELEKSEGRSKSSQDKMEALGVKMDELGKKMGKLGEEMGKYGEEMGKYGEKMGKLHQAMNDWFFRELKKDGLLKSLDGKTRILFDDKGLDVDGNKASDALFQKYKSGLEKHWGRTLKPDFVYFFKGTISEKNGNIRLDGNMNTDF